MGRLSQHPVVGGGQTPLRAPGFWLILVSSPPRRDGILQVQKESKPRGEHLEQASTVSVCLGIRGGRREPDQRFLTFVLAQAETLRKTLTSDWQGGTLSWTGLLGRTQA